jgi:glucose uptake protein GlcU
VTPVLAALAPGALYCAACFAAGAVMGPIRVLVLEPRIGMAAAVAVEAPLILAVAALAARAVLRRWPAVSPLAVGVVGLALLLVAETALAAALDRQSPFDAPRLLAEWIGLALKLAFALMPAALARRA